MRRSEEMDLARRALRGRDLVVFSNDWDGDPLSKVHIMRILSRDNRVLWVNSIGNRAPKANAHDVQRIWKKLASFTEGIREVEPNLFVLAPLAIPFYGSELVRTANRELLRAQVLRAAGRIRRAASSRRPRIADGSSSARFRISNSSSQRFGTMLSATPPAILPTVSTTGSKTSKVRVTIDCSARTISQAAGMGSRVRNGAEPWPPSPTTRTRTSSTAAMSGPGRPNHIPRGYSAE